MCQLRLFRPFVPPRAVEVMVVDNPDEISELHAFIVLLEQTLAGLGLGVGDDQEMMVIVVHLMQVLEIPAQQQTFLVLVFYLKVVLFLQVHFSRLFIIIRSQQLPSLKGGIADCGHDGRQQEGKGDDGGQ